RPTGSTLSVAMLEPINTFNWIVPDRLGVCPHPSVSQPALDALHGHRISLIINLHERPNRAELLQSLGPRQLPLPVADSFPPPQPQLDLGVAEISSALAAGERVVVHCGAGLGRSGTLLAAYFVHTGLSPEVAIDHVRAARPGSIETAEQEAAVARY